VIIHYTAVNSPLGRLYLGRHPQGLCALTLGDDAWNKLVRYVDKTWPEAELQDSKSMFKGVIQELHDYFRGDRTHFDVPLLLKGTDFQKKVWKGLLEIPYGTTLSYGELADRLNNPGGMRAVGAANGQNPVPVIVPCHRVIAADGSLGGYTGGLGIKRKLLNLEQQKFTPTFFQ